MLKRYGGIFVKIYATNYIKACKSISFTYSATSTK